MRYYELTCSDPQTGDIWKPNSTDGKLTKSAGGSTFSSVLNGKNNPGALNIEFDLPNVVLANPQGQAIIRVWGVGLQMLGQAADLNGQNFVLRAGMGKGLPLANPAQAGVIVQGQIFQAFGNWQGTNQTLDLVCNPGALLPDQNVSFTWKAGKTLASALFATLAQAFPTYKAKINISPSLVLASDEYGHYDTLADFADYISQISKMVGGKAVGPDYPGVDFHIAGDTITVTDQTTPPKLVQLAFQDLIGQPTWIGATAISFKTVLRADISVGDQVQFPQGVVLPYALTSAKAAIPNAPSRSKIAFQGKFVINEVHYFANFRQPDADSWNTSFTAVSAS